MIRIARALLLLALAAAGACSAPQLRPTSGAPTASADPGRMVVITVRNPIVPGLRGAGSTWRGWDMSGNYEAAAAVEATVRALRAAHDLAPVDAWPIVLLGVHCVVLEIAGAQPRERVLTSLRADSRVESAQALQVFGTMTAGYDDPYRDMQYSLAAMQLEQAHRWTQGRGVKVAVIDTGIDFGHPDLRGRVVAHHDLVGHAGARFEDDRHGTAVAGVIAAAAGNGLGIVGVAPQARLIALKACWPLVRGASPATCNSFTLARALAAAVELDADVLNLSLAGPPDPLLERLVRLAVARGILVVGALPEAPSPAQLVFPASIEGVIGVRSADATGARTTTIAAPGIDIITTAPGAAYGLQSGSSLAAAHISGVAALLRELRPELTPPQLEELLIDATASTGIADPPGVNACAAVIRLLREGSCHGG